MTLGTLPASPATEPVNPPHIFRTIMFAAVLADVPGGLIPTVLEQFGTVPLILEAEVLERSERTPAGPSHQHTAAVTIRSPTTCWARAER